MSTGFVSEKELDEKRKKRQEEWERVRRPDEPLEAPEEVYDPRSLFERLQEQKEKKELEWEEAHKLKNQVRGLDVEEIGFLDYVDDVKLREEKSRRDEEKKLLNEFRSAVSSLQEKALGDRVKDAKKPVALSLKAPTQKSSLIGVVRKKTTAHQESPEPVTEKGTENHTNGSKTETKSPEGKKPVVLKPQVVAVLPGLGTYTDSSDSDLDSSGSETDSPPPKRRLDLLGRALEKSSES